MDDMPISSQDPNIIFDGAIAVTGTDFDTDIFEAEDIRTVIVRVEGPQQGIKVTQAVNESQAFSNGAVELGNGEYLLCSRYFALHVDVNGTGTLLVSIRVGSRINQP
jgi:hypothetical protein